MVYYAQKSGHMAACGAACHKKGSAFMPDRIQIKEEAKQVLGADEIIIDIRLRDGAAGAVAWGCDLTYDYVKINGDYRT